MSVIAEDSTGMIAVPKNTTATPTTTVATAGSGGLTPQGIAEIYEVLAPMSTDYANANLERAGQAQASYGPLAQAAMGNSQTAGVGNYTYNRLVRPAVDTMRDQLIVEGYSNALNKQISDSLRNAQENYNRAARRYNRSGGNGGGTTKTPGTTNPGTGQTKIGGSQDKQLDGYDNTPGYWDGSFTITYPDGTKRKFDRPTNSFTDDLEWYNWVQQLKKKSEARGEKFELGGRNVN